MLNYIAWNCIRVIDCRAICRNFTVGNVSTRMIVKIIYWSSEINYFSPSKTWWIFCFPVWSNQPGDWLYEFEMIVSDRLRIGLFPKCFTILITLIKYRNIQWTIQWIRFGVLDLKFLFYSVIIQNCRKPTNVSKVRQRHGTLVYSRNELVAYISDLVNS